MWVYELIWHPSSIFKVALLFFLEPALSQTFLQITTLLPIIIFSGLLILQGKEIKELFPNLIRIKLMSWYFNKEIQFFAS